MFPFKYLKANFTEICKEISFLSFSEKCCCQHFCCESRLIISKNAWLPQFFFVDSNSPFKDLLFPRDPNLAQSLGI